MNIITVFLIEPATLRLSFDFDREINARIKTIPGYKWVGESKIWTVPLSEIDRLISEFGEQLAVWPDVFMAAEGEPTEYVPARVLTKDQRLANFVKELGYAGITLTNINGRLMGSGGAYCADPWQRLIDERRDALLQLGYGSGKTHTAQYLTGKTLDSSQSVPTVTLDDPRLTEFDRFAATHWDTWKKNQEEEDALIVEAKRKRWGRKAAQPELLEVE